MMNAIRCLSYPTRPAAAADIILPSWTGRPPAPLSWVAATRLTKQSPTGMLNRQPLREHLTLSPGVAGRSATEVMPRPLRGVRSGHRDGRSGPGADQGPRGIILSAIVTRAAVRDYGEHRLFLPGRRCTAILPVTCARSPGRYTPPPAGPQGSIIALLASGVRQTRWRVVRDLPWLIVFAVLRGGCGWRGPGCGGC